LRRIAASEARRNWLLKLDEALLVGGAIIPEWCTLMIFEADTCFVAGADISTIIVATAAIETFLRSEANAKKSMRLVDLVRESDLPDELADEIGSLRKKRNRWVHLKSVNGDDNLNCYTDAYSEELENDAYRACRALREVIYLNQFL